MKRGKEVSQKRKTKSKSGPITMRIRQLKKGDRRSRKKKQIINRKQRQKTEEILKVKKEKQNVEKRWKQVMERKGRRKREYERGDSTTTKELMFCHFCSRILTEPFSHKTTSVSKIQEDLLRLASRAIKVRLPCSRCSTKTTASNAIRKSLSPFLELFMLRVLIF